MCSLGSLRSSEIKPAGSIRLSSNAQSLESCYRMRGSLAHLVAWAETRTTIRSVAVNGYETTARSILLLQLHVCFCCLLSNGGVLSTPLWLRKEFIQGRDFRPSLFCCGITWKRQAVEDYCFLRFCQTSCWIWGQSIIYRTILTAQEIVRLLEFCLNATYLTYCGEVYQQVFGTAMGSPVCYLITYTNFKSYKSEYLHG